MIDKVGAIIIENKKLLVVRSFNKPWFFIPGGKREGAETDEECLRREILEELQATITTVAYYKEFYSQAMGKTETIRIRTYLCTLANRPKPGTEIEELTWINGSFDSEKLADVLKIMIPELERDGFL